MNLSIKKIFNRQYGRQFISTLLLLVIIVVPTYFVTEKNNDAIEKVTPQKEYWNEQIQTLGGESAYKKLSVEVADKTINERHAVAHTFGGSLYEIEGVSGLVVCDTQFSFGCFHEFLGRAIAEEGLSVVNSLNTACVERLTTTALSCQHGIGHGIVGYVGYTKENLNTGLAICKSLPFGDPIGGCYSGVFMEYNLRTMLGSEARLREVVEGNIFAPCDTVEEPYRAACAFWQPQWWQQAVYSGSQTSETFRKIGKNCTDMVATEPLRRACFEGVGTIVISASEYNPERAAMLCNAVSSNKLYSLFCKSNAANGIGLENKKVDATKTCADLSGAAKEYCTEYAFNRANIANQKQLPFSP